MNDDRYAPFGEGPQACPFLAFEDDRDRRGDRPDYRHRCFASSEPEPRAFPHQERYCLSPGFTECPIFLEWARRESASVVAARRPMPAPAQAPVEASPGPSAPSAAVAGAAAGAAASGVRGQVEDEAEPPPFLSSRPARPAADGIDAEVPRRAPTPEEGLWGAESEQRRRQPGTVTGTARANVSRPAWEPPSRLENYPRIRDRRGGGSRTPLLLAAVAVIALMVVLFLVPLLAKSPGIGGGGGGGSTPTVAPSVSVKPSASVKPTPKPSPTLIAYRIQKNDTLSTIADKFGVTIDDIIAANPQIKNPDVVAEGQLIYIPPTGSAQASPSGP